MSYLLTFKIAYLVQVNRNTFSCIFLNCKNIPTICLHTWEGYISFIQLRFKIVGIFQQFVDIHVKIAGCRSHLRLNYY